VREFEGRLRPPRGEESGILPEKCRIVSGEYGPDECVRFFFLFAMALSFWDLSIRISDLEIELHNTTEGRRTEEREVIQDLEDQ